MIYTPLFIDVEFGGVPQAEAGVLTPVSAVRMGFVKGGVAGEDDDVAEYAFDGDDMWEKACSFLTAFRNASAAPVAIVGFNLRNLVWPAFVFNAAAHGGHLPKEVLKPLDRRWNDCLMVDLRDALLQGGYSDRARSVSAVRDEFASAGASPPKGTIQFLRFMHDRYVDLARR